MNSWSKIIFLALLAAVESAKILIAIPFSGRSHYICTRNVGLELARRGHDVYVITSNTEKEKLPNYHEIVIEHKELWDMVPGITKPPISEMNKLSFLFLQYILYSTGLKHSEYSLNSTEVQKLFNQNHKFDLVISEVFIHDAFYMLAHYYNAPLVLLTTVGNSFRTNYAIRNPTQISTVMHEYIKEKTPQSFMGRMHNFINCFFEIMLYKFYVVPQHQSIATKYMKKIPEPVPNLDDVTANASLVLLNSHFSIDGPVAYLPNVVEVGGLHIEKNDNKLPDDLQKIMDSSSDGVIYVSFGTVLSGKDLPDENRDALLKVFAKLNQKVLFKWEDDKLNGKPKNVEIRNWFPQRELLAHPNMKLFIAHGGLIGLQEASYYGVPVLGIPIFGDQLNNVLQAKKMGNAEFIEFSDLNEDLLGKYVQKMLSSNNYSIRAKEISNRFKDRPMSGLDTAMYWIEYVIKHKGAPFIKSSGLELSALAYHMLDVIFVLILALLSILTIVIKTFNACRRKNKTPSNEKKKKQ